MALRDHPHVVDEQVLELPRVKWAQHTPLIGLLRDVAVDHLQVESGRVLVAGSCDQRGACNVADAKAVLSALSSGVLALSFK